MTPNFVLIAAREGRFPPPALRPRHRPLDQVAPNHHLRPAPFALRLRSCPFACSAHRFPNPEKQARSSPSRVSRSFPGQPRRAHLLHSRGSLRLLRSVHQRAPRRLLHLSIAPRPLRPPIPQRLLRRPMRPRPSATCPYRLPIHRSCRRRPEGGAGYLQF
jgi:hypothetical protein